MKITWLDLQREPVCKPDPKYPDGIDVDAAAGAKMTCKVDLPYPARRCGYYRIECEECGQSYAVTTAGRPDDPRSVTIPCKATKQ